MPRATRNRPASGTASRPLASLLAHSTTPNELLPHLHQHALDLTGGARSLLFQWNPRTGGLQATSGFGLDYAQDRPLAARTDRDGRRGRRVRAPRADIGRRHGSPDAGSRGAPRNASGAAAAAHPPGRASRAARGRFRRRRRRPADIAANAVEAADAFVTALELFRLRQTEELQRDVRALLDEFTSVLSATLNLSAGLDIFCHGANRLFAADRTSVWIHDRRARHLVLQASSDPADLARGVADRRRRSLRARGGRDAPRPRRNRAAIERRSRRRWSPCRCAAAGAPSARSSSKACGSRPAASSTCSIAPTSSGASSRARSRTCSCSTT